MNFNNNGEEFYSKTHFYNLSFSGVCWTPERLLEKYMWAIIVLLALKITKVKNQNKKIKL